MSSRRYPPYFYFRPSQAPSNAAILMLNAALDPRWGMSKPHESAKRSLQSAACRVQSAECRLQMAVFPMMFPMIFPGGRRPLSHYPIIDLLSINHPPMIHHPPLFCLSSIILHPSVPRIYLAHISLRVVSMECTPSRRLFPTVPTVADSSHSWSEIHGRWLMRTASFSPSILPLS